MFVFFFFDEWWLAYITIKFGKIGFMLRIEIFTAAVIISGIFCDQRKFNIRHEDWNYEKDL